MSLEYGKIAKPIIRTASFDDILDIRKMQAESWIETYPSEKVGISQEWVENYVKKWFSTENLEDTRKYFSGVFGNPNHYYRVASEGDSIIGLIHASKIDDKQQLGAIYINKNQYGTGLAQQMINGAFEWLDLNKPVTLEVASYNERAIAFYRKNGFEIIEGSENISSDLIPTIGMARKGEKK